MLSSGRLSRAIRLSVIGAVVILGLTAVLGGAVSGGATPGRTSTTRAMAATSPAVTVGMPFAGKWAYNQKVLPPYVDTCPGGGYSCPGLSSHPSVHKTDGGGDWATDLYAPAGTQVRLRVKISSGQLSYAWKTSTGCPDSTWILVKVDGAPVGTIYYSHLAKGATRSGPITNGMLLGRIADPSTDGNCNPGPHVHIELKNSRAGSYACWTDHGNPGVKLDEGTPIGVLGRPNAGRKSSCAASGSPPPNSHWVVAPTTTATAVLHDLDRTTRIFSHGICYRSRENFSLDFPKRLTISIFGVASQSNGPLRNGVKYATSFDENLEIQRLVAVLYDGHANLVGKQFVEFTGRRTGLFWIYELWNGYGPIAGSFVRGNFTC